MESVSERVRLGAEFLDATVGLAWPGMIELPRLDIASGCNCVAAQIVEVADGYSSPWANAMHEWGIVDEDGGLDMEAAKALGFLGGEDEEEALNREWSALIERRLP